MALNTAHTDLSALAPRGHETTLSREQRVYIGLDGYDGAGADLNYGRECIRENAERIRQAVAAHAEGADVVLLTAGLGGGTGSALSELCDVLADLELPLVTLATLPGEHESGIAKVNAARGVSELVKRRPYGWVFADNQRLAQSHGNVSLDRYYEAINQVIVAPLDALNRLNNREEVHPLRTLDGEDLRRLLLSGGVLNYAETLLPGHGGHDTRPAESGTTAAGSSDHAEHSPAKQPSKHAPASGASTFTCPMHPEIVRDGPGKCPICGMDLVPKQQKSTHPPH